ncbi:TlpA disulfide reductase family protein [Flavobacterium sp. RHBU_24]|uniref:TlpA disulfide reductase family protein n=1 Tax=Flavobacterium sp. RHBU_24 TaxID=3391185 RepID=UPI003984DBFF
MKKLLIYGTAIFTVLIIMAFANAKAQGEPRPVHVYTNGKTTVKAYEWEGLNYYLSRKNDTTYVVNFWATWCVPCVEELPNFEKLNEKYKGEKVKVILVSLDMPKMAENRLLPFMERKKLQSKVILMRDPDQNTWLPKVNPDWSGAIPATVIYSKGKRKFYERSFTYEELENELINFK